MLQFSTTNEVRQLAAGLLFFLPVTLTGVYDISPPSEYFIMKHAFVFVAIFALFSLVLIQPAMAAINPKAVDSATIRITKGGTLTPSGSIQSASLSLYIAQEGPCLPQQTKSQCQQSIEVSPSDWEYASDASGNRMVMIHFKDLSQTQSYSVVQVIKTSALRLDAETSLDGDAAYSAETSGAQITPNISAAAYPFERTLSGVAEMAAWVHGYVKYDTSVFGLNEPSDWVMANKRGVCVEFSNLLAAMLRSRGIATRYVNGYAYSIEDNSLIGHEWVEVLAGGTGGSAADAASSWVGFDPTWLEGGFIDATHVRTSVSKDGIQKETLSYLGNGNIDWKKNPEPDYVELLDYSTDNGTIIAVEAPQNLPLAGGGYVKATVSYPGCTMAQLRASSCTNAAGRSMLDMQGSNTRNLWLCSSASAFWAFTTALASGYTYSCPVIVYDQSGAEAEETISISGDPSGQAPTISGPDSAGVNKPFTIQASPDSKLFSTELGEAPSAVWSLTLMEPGTYNFYAYANGRLASKAVDVRYVEEFELSVGAPASVNQSMSFIVTAALRNIGAAAKAVTIKAAFGNQTLEQQTSIDAGQTRTFSFNFTAHDAGTAKYTVSALSDTYTGYSGNVNIVPAPPAPKSLIDAILDAIRGFVDWLMSFFRK